MPWWSPTTAPRDNGDQLLPHDAARRGLELADKTLLARRASEGHLVFPKGMPSLARRATDDCATKATLFVGRLSGAVPETADGSGEPSYTLLSYRRREQ
jgi:hypothetical protein